MAREQELSARIKQAEDYYQQGKFIEAIAICRQVIQIQPDFAQAYHTMGNIFFAQGQIDLASQAYRQAIECNPELPSPYANLGNLFYQQGNLEEAIAHYNQALAINPNLAEVYWNLAKALARQGRQKQAIICQEVALELKPTLAGVDTHQKLGQILVQQGQLDGAIRSYQRALQINPDVAEIYLNLGVLWKQQDNLTAAIQSYQEAIALNPNLFEAYFNLGNAFEYQGDHQQAIAAYLQALQIKPNFLKAYYKIAQCLEHLGRSDEAKSCYDSHLPPNLCSEFFPECPPVISRSIFEQVPRVEIKQIYQPSQINLRSAMTLDPQLHPEFQGDEYQFNSAFIAIFSHIRVWADSENIAVINCQNQLIAELCQGSPDLIVTSEKLSDPIFIDGTVAFLSVRDAHNYFHWMFDLLPRLHLIQASGMDLTEIDRFIVNSCQKPFQRETLKLLGIPEDKLIESDRYPHIEAKTMLVPSLHRMSDRITNWGGNFLRRQFSDSSLNLTDDLTEKNISYSRTGKNPSSPEPSPTHDRLYISRKSAQYRRILNELELIEFLSAYGFRTITLESLSFEEQVTLMANATVVVSPHGAGLTNLIFSPPGSVVIELFSPDYLYNLYWLISNLSQLKYYYLIGEDVEPYYLALGQEKPQYIHPAGEDILVNLDRLRSLMQLAGVI